MVIRRGLTVVVVEVPGLVVDVADAGAIVVVVVEVVVPPPLGTVVVVEVVEVVEVDEIVNEIDDDVAAPWEPLAAIDAVIVQVPAVTKVTTPVDVPIVQTEVVELEYDFEPPPADAVEVIVGGGSVSSYEDEYDDASIVNVRLSSVIVKVLVEEVAVAYPDDAAILAEIEQLPVATKATTPLEALTVQIDAVELE
jgi:hypothetical protein